MRTDGSGNCSFSRLKADSMSTLMRLFAGTGFSFRTVDQGDAEMMRLIAVEWRCMGADLENTTIAQDQEKTQSHNGRSTFDEISPMDDHVPLSTIYPLSFPPPSNVGRVLKFLFSLRPEARVSEDNGSCWTLDWTLPRFTFFHRCRKSYPLCVEQN